MNNLYYASMTDVLGNKFVCLFATENLKTHFVNLWDVKTKEWKSCYKDTKDFKDFSIDGFANTFAIKMFIQSDKFPNYMPSSCKYNDGEVFVFESGQDITAFFDTYYPDSSDYNGFAYDDKEEDRTSEKLITVDDKSLAFELMVEEEFKVNENIEAGHLSNEFIVVKVPYIREIANRTQNWANAFSYIHDSDNCEIILDFYLVKREKFLEDINSKLFNIIKNNRFYLKSYSSAPELTVRCAVRDLLEHYGFKRLGAMFRSWTINGGLTSND